MKPDFHVGDRPRPANRTGAILGHSHRDARGVGVGYSGTFMTVTTVDVAVVLSS